MLVMEKHIKVNLRESDIKELIDTHELIIYMNGKEAKEENKVCRRIIRQCKKALESLK